MKVELVGIVYGRNAVKWAKEAKGIGATLIEVRLDLYDHYSIDTFRTSIVRIKNEIALPIIATLRDKKEGGKCDIKKLERYKIFSNLIDLVDYVDIELNFGKLLDKIITLAHNNRKKVILSYHNLLKTPSDKKLYSIAEKAHNKSADIIKVVTYANSKEDVIRLLIFTYNCQYKPLISMALGKMGRISRIVAPLFGSSFSYGYIKDEVAVGQFSLKELRTIYDKIAS